MAIGQSRLKLETTYISFYRIEYLRNNKKEWTIDLSNNMDEF